MFFKIILLLRCMDPKKKIKLCFVSTYTDYKKIICSIHNFILNECHEIFNLYFLAQNTPPYEHPKTVLKNVSPSQEYSVFDCKAQIFVSAKSATTQTQYSSLSYPPIFNV